MIRATLGWEAVREIAEQSALTAAMDNRLAGLLGDLARVAGNPDRQDVGDNIDRGLILRRLLAESGFALYYVGPPL